MYVDIYIGVGHPLIVYTMYVEFNEGDIMMREKEREREREREIQSTGKKLELNFSLSQHHCHKTDQTTEESVSISFTIVVMLAADSCDFTCCECIR